MGSNMAEISPAAWITQPGEDSGVTCVSVYFPFRRKLFFPKRLGEVCHYSSIH